MYTILRYDRTLRPLITNLPWYQLYTVGPEETPVRAGNFVQKEGKIRFYPENRQPVGFGMPLDIPDFGEVVLVADNEGKGYKEARERNFNFEAAKSRYHLVEKLLTDYQNRGYKFSEEIFDNLDEAKHYLAKATGCTLEEQKAHWANLCLSKILWADEWMESKRAEQDTSNWTSRVPRAMPVGECAGSYPRVLFSEGKQRGLLKVPRALPVGFPPNHVSQKAGADRSDFKVGCAIGWGGSKEHLQREELKQAYTELFDFGMVPFYWKAIQPAKGSYTWQDTLPLEWCCDCEWRGVEERLKFAREVGVESYGHALCYLAPFNLPGYIKDSEGEFKQIKEQMQKMTQKVLNRYKSEIFNWEIHTELVQNWCNPFGFSMEQRHGLVRESLDWIESLQPDAQVTLDNCLPWGEYICCPDDSIRKKLKLRNFEDEEILPLWEYYRRLINEGKVTNFILGCQMYNAWGSYNCRDLAAISRMLDRLGSVGQQVRVTAVDTPGCAGKGVNGSWHTEWNTEREAEWKGKFLMLAYSKPFVRDVCFWADTQYHKYVSGSGFLDQEFNALPSYEVVKDFQKYRKKHEAKSRD